MAKLFEYCNTEDNDRAKIYGIYWGAQTFTPVVMHIITGVTLLLCKGWQDSPGTVTVSIRATDEDGKPTGNDLCAGTTNGNTLPDDLPYEWRHIAFTSGYTLIAGTKYAIVVRALSGTPTEYIMWREITPGTYNTGCECDSEDSGETWTKYEGGGIFSDFDYMFEDWGVRGKGPLPLHFRQ